MLPKKRRTCFPALPEDGDSKLALLPAPSEGRVLRLRLRLRQEEGLEAPLCRRWGCRRRRLALCSWWRSSDVESGEHTAVCKMCNKCFISTGLLMI
mmetsp:Transcript_49701/g.85449  ORF Transcript_49701/g.85449 Transcript_49701/m.85449 type:complete len:96 (-) Transcript_49701:1071-1358(-)